MVDISKFPPLPEDGGSPNWCWNRVSEEWPFSLWLLKPEYLRKACTSGLAKKNCPNQVERMQRFLDKGHGEALDQTKGCCYVVFALGELARMNRPYLRPAFALPLVWRQTAHHGTGIPPKLQTMADDICQQIAPASGWKLDFNLPENEKKDLRESVDSLSYGSGWAALAGGLLLAMEGGTPDPTVWASAAWDFKELGVAPVDGLAEKLEAILDLGGKTVFVPKQDLAKGKEIAQKLQADQGAGLLDLQSLPQHSNDPREALKPYLATLEFPPDPSRDLKAGCRYYYRQLKFHQEKAKEYYRHRLQKELVKACQKLGIEGMTQEEVKHIHSVISFVSFNPDGAVFVLATLKPSQVLLFYTSAVEKERCYIEEQIEANVVKVLYDDSIPLEADRTVCQEIKKFVATHGADKTALDITPGTKAFSQIASWTLDPQVSPFLYLRHGFEALGLNPGKEQIRRLRPQV